MIEQVNGYIWTSQVFHLQTFLWIRHWKNLSELEVAGGTTGITQDIDVLDRFFMIAPELMSLIQIFQHDFGVNYNKQTTKEHYELSSTTAIRMFTKSSLSTAIANVLSLVANHWHRR